MEQFIDNTRAHFSDDDYYDILRTYFQDIVNDRSWKALPAGWHNPHSEAAAQFKVRGLNHTLVQQYAVDEGVTLGRDKAAIVELVSAWENRPVHHDELTLLPSVSSANLTTMSVLAASGFHNVVFETPTYYATLDQAILLGLNYVRVPSFRVQQFDAELRLFEQAIRMSEPCSLWLTQPRFGLGTNQEIERIRALGEILGKKNVLVIDEAAEQGFPSTLSPLTNLPCSMIRTRGLLKGVGLNGLRIAFALHSAELRPVYVDTLETVGASLDRFSLTNAAALAETPDLFQSLLAQANKQVRALRKELSTLSLTSWMEPYPLVNGYMGMIMLDLRRLAGTYEQKRAAFLASCRSQRLPVVLKANIGFADDDQWEGVRINYFTSRENVIKSGETLLEVYQDLSHDRRGA